MAKLVRHLTSNEEIVGSNPAESMCLYVLLFLHQKQNDVSVVWDVIEFFLSLVFIRPFKIARM